MLKRFITILFLLCLLGPGLASAAEAPTALPTMMVGQAYLGDPDLVDPTYGGMNGNYAVLNYDSNSDYGFNNTSLLAVPDCMDLPLLPGLCFVLGRGVSGETNAGNGRLMTSRTTLAGNTVHEIPALYLGGINIWGDAYFGSTRSDNFAFWGRSLAQSGSGSIPSSWGASWNISNYVQNPASKFDCTAGSGKDFIGKITAMKGEGGDAIGSVNSDTGSPWNLQGSMSNGGLIDVGNTDANSYPQGKVWTVSGDLDITQSKKYHGQGTIIVEGNLAFADGVTIEESTVDSSDNLGFIVFGDVTFVGNNKVVAPIIAVDCTGSRGVMTFSGDNVALTGSYVANTFTFANMDNIKVIYDPALDSNWPPGFRYLAMPGMKPVKNQ